MKVRFSVCTIFAILALFVLQTAKVSASTPSVPPGACLYALDATAADAFQIAGAQSVYTACGVVSESSSSSAFEMEGAETLYLENHAQVSVVGGADLTGQTYLYDTIGGKDVQAVQVTSPGDPLASITAPTSGTMAGKSPTYYDMNAKPANNTISPGIYCGGLTIGNTNGTTFTFSPGMYIMAGGGLTLESEAMVKGAGVTFYNTSSTGWGCSSSYSYKPITVSGQVDATFSAPTSGAFDGILFFGNRTGCSIVGSCVDQINGGSTAILNGALYFKSDEIEITGSNASGYTTLVADKIYINGNSNFGENGSPFDDITVSVSPATASLFAGQTQQFTATVDNTGNTAVTWTISPSSAGSISSSGLYTAPSSITAQQTVTVTATSEADDTKSGSATIVLLPRQTPVITWATPAAITYGTALSATQLDATANVPGTFTYTPAAGTVLAAGSQTLTVTFTPTNTTDYTTTTASVTLTVNKATPVITWATPGAITYGTALSPIQLDATANVAGTFAYSPAAGAVLAAGSQTLSTAFTPTNTTDYTTATASVTLTVNQATPAISISDLPASSTYGGSFTATIAYSGNGNPTETIASSTPSVCAVSGLVVSYVGVGICSLTASATATTDYSPVTGSVQSFSVGKATLTITASSPTVTYGSAVPAITPSYSGFVNGDNTASLTTAPSCSTTYTVTSAPGSYPSTCSGAVDANYTISYVGGTVTVNQGTSAITWVAPASITYGTALSATQLDATANVPGTFTYSPAVGTVLAAGTQTLSVTFTPTNTTDYTTATASVTLTVNQATPTITWATPGAIAYGTALSSTQLDATANVPGAFVYSPAAGVIPPAGSQTLSVTFTPTDTTDYATATASVVLTVIPGQCNTNGYSYARAVTIDHTKVPNTDQTNFPFLFNTTDPLLATTANGGHVANPNGYDIIFTSDPAGQNPLPYEMEQYNPATGQVIAWVQIPDLSHTSDTTIYLFYGNPNVTASQQNPTAVWDSNYKGVWHLGNGSALSLNDSTTNANNATDNGALAAPGPFAGGMQTNGSTYATIGTPSSLADLAQGPATFSVWVNSAAGLGGKLMGKDDGNGEEGWALSLNGNHNVDFVVVYSGGDFRLPSNGATGNNTWSYVTVTLNGNANQSGSATIYINGVADTSGSGGSGSTVDDSAQVAYLANATFGDQESAPFNGTTAEFRISNTIRSADWIATEYANQSSPSTFFNLSSENIAITPDSATLYELQTQQFTPIGLSTCEGGIAWSISPAGVGIITQSGLYTAPAAITTQQTVTITAANQANPSISASATITLIPPVAVSVTPATVTIATNGGDQQQFTATVINASNTAVTWSLSPSGTGTIDQTGLYTAPELITSQQTVTVTATSQFDPTKSASATITLAPPSLPSSCGSNGYSFVRAIAIDHTKVPNTDQVNFPFLFNTTDPLLATSTNGGHVANFYGYDIIFTSDPAGQNPLPYEMEEYNPQTGTVIAWVQIPDLSHSSDTTIYLFYGNPSITSSQQNPSAVWDSNYLGVWHLANNNGSVSAMDSTANGNNGNVVGASPTTGEIDGALNNPHSSSGYINLSSAPLATAAPPSAFTVEAWVNIAGLGNFPAIVDFDANNSNNWGLYVEGGSGIGAVIGNDMPWEISSGSIPAGWNHIIATSDANGPAMYLNGVPAGTSWSDSSYENSATSASIGLGYGAQLFNGSIDEVRVSNIVRSPDWIATEYANQSSPSTFYQLYSENFEGVVPAAPALSASQSQQFTALSGCGAAAATWSLPAGSPGTLTTGGLYTAPASIATQQTVTITAISQTNGSTIGTSVVTLLPAMTVSPAAPTLYTSYQTLQFTAMIGNSATSSVTWSISPANIGSITQTGLYTAPSFDSQETVTITATNVQDSAQSVSTTVTLIPVLVTPNSVNMYAGFSQQFTADVPVVWSLGQGAIGTISQTGLYTAPLSGNTSFPLIATAQADPNATYTASISLINPVHTPVTPAAVSLYGGQSQSFNACLAASAYADGCSGNSNGPIWSISPAGAGTISSTGVYTAPPLIPTQQTVIVTATSPGNPAITSSGTISLLAPVVSLKPQSATLYADQTQQFTSVVTNSSNTAVTWSISPAGVGSISSNGEYTAPSYIASQQTVTITATLQAIPSITGSAVIALSPAQCPNQAYGYVRPIVIDHTKVPDSDEPNFPFYFAVTDPLLASTSNGGHVNSLTGNDIVFTSDPAGLQPLPFDLEQYNPATGQIVAWVKVPVLSHSQDTVIYLFYGNPNITAPQQNPTAVWDTNYTAVYQFEDLQNGNLLDSTINGNNASSNNVQEVSGQPGEAGAFDGQTSYVTLPSNDFSSYPTNNTAVPLFNASFGVWFKTASTGVILGQTGTTTPGNGPNGWVPALYIDTNGYLRATFFDFRNDQQIVSPTVLNDNNWHYAVLTFETDNLGNTVNLNGVPSGVETMYVDGQIIGQLSGLVPDGYTSSYSYFLGTGDASSWSTTSSNNNGWFYFNGSLDEAEVSSIPRSSGWVQAEYNNQSSPSTFYALGTEAGATPTINPSTVALNQSASQQFTVLQTGLCTAGDAVWSMPSGSPGTLSPTGLYTAPEAINTQQIVTVTATTLGANSTTLNATITLMPPVAISVTPGVVSLPNGGTQQFTATVSNTSNTAVTWTVDPAGDGSISSIGLYTAPATLSGQTVNVIATSVADPTQSASATVTLGQAAAAVPAITINPPSALLYPAQGQQFIATVANTANPAVIWSITPAGVGTIDDTGFYTAPASIAAGQTITITATSEANPSIAASVSVVIVPACASDGYVRQIVINASQVQNSDQANFPFLLNTTDPLLAATAYGGHVSNLNGNDIFFTSDPAGQNPLPYEVEEYNPQTGQVIAWVKIPNLSHTSNTTIYLFYGNPSITSSRQNPTAVWDSNFVGVWHLPNGSVLSANDSTVNGNNGTPGDGVSATAGFIDGGASFSGASSAYINIPSSSSSWNFARDVTVSAWIKTASNRVGVVQAQGGNPLFYLEVGPSTVGGNANVAVAYFRTDSGSVLVANGNKPIDDNNWHYIQAVRSTGNSVNIYVDGILDSTTPYSDNGPIDNSGGAVNIGGFGSSYDLIGTIDEVRVSNVARSADWIATEYTNQTSPSTFYSVSAEETQGILPASVTLYPNQSQQFAFPGLCGDISWSLSSGAQGTLSSSGLYTAPSVITEQQTLTVTATSVANPTQSATATVTLMPPVSVAISPASITLNQNQNQQFTAIVNNSTNTAVTWSMSPAGLGSLDQNGGYIAPSSITVQQTVTITATSVTDPTKSASAMITLAPSICASTGYGNQRVILIDHTKVPNTDQINFPFLFNTTDPDLATVDNGGHVANPNGYDIIFSTDPNGQTKLDFEIEQYNPVTGQLVAWIRIPTLSHSTDTVIYVFYGNPAITTPQANPAGVWDSNYQAVYHLGNLPATEIASDSTSYANDASFINFVAEPGQIDGSAGLDGVTSYLQIPSTAFPNYPTSTIPDSIPTSASGNGNAFAATFGIWFKTNSWGGLLDQTSGETCTIDLFICITYGPEQVGDVPYGSWSSLLDVNFDGQLSGNGVGPTTQTYNDNNWHFAAITFQNETSTLYADGQVVGSGQPAVFGFSPTYAYFVGTVDAESDTSSQDSQPWKYLPGQIDEINVSNIARSSDWIQTQFNNQGSPSTFYKFYSPNAVQVAPSSISLYAAQSELFTVPGTCDATITWSLSTGSAGTLTSTGIYTAPSVVSSQQTVTVSAMSQSNGSSFGSAQVTLLPVPQPLTLIASSPSPYQVGAAQSFTGTLLDPQGNPLIGVTVNFTVAGPNETVGGATTNASGTATFTYTGSNSGTDTVQATASVDGSLLTSNSLSAVWLTPPPAQAPTLTLLPQPSLGRGGLMGAFTDSNGDLIEPIEIGTAARTFITPVGATRLQLGINDTYYEINGGTGFVVAVNGSNVSVPPTAMPWKWKTGGLNNNYQYGVNDGTSPVIAASSLTAGQPVTIAYQSGTISTNYPVSAPVNANGDSSSITGTQILDGAYFPTLYTTATAYPQNQPVNVFATAVDATGAPIPNTPVTLTVSGANPGQFQATTDATGTASFLYTGQYAGNDSLQALALLTGQGMFNSNLTTINWTNYPTPPPVGSLPLVRRSNNSNYEYFDFFAYDASGNIIPNVNVGLYVSGIDNFQTSLATNNIGQAEFTYLHDQSGTANVFAVDTVDRNVIVTQPISDTWTLQPGSPTSAGGTITIGISADTTVTIPNALQLTGTVTDSSGLTPTLAWTQVSGPGTVTFATPTQASTTATFSQVGTYVLELSANDTVNSGWAQFTVSVLAPSTASQAQGWIGSPAYGATVSGVVPISLAPGITLASGTLSYAPAGNPNSTTVLNANVSGAGQIGTLDATALANGSYLIQMQGTDTGGNSQYSLILVTVTGNYKPGRVTTTVTDLVVPATGLPINIQRTYDSLNAGTIGDFGYGWNLGINVDLTVDTSGNVTFTIGGQRRTFYLTPTYGGWLFPWYFPAFTPQSGAFGTLADTGSSCPLDFVVPNGSLWDCYGGSGQYTPSGYVYTDPTGTAYTMSAGGQLQSVTDKNGNGLTIGPNGITSTTGLNVPFVRDAENRITQITDPAGNVYSYNYDANGDLVSVTYPPAQSSQVCAGASAPNTSQYTYAPNHYYESGTDGNCNPLPSTTYYAAGETDASGNYSVAGKLQSVTDALGETTSYTYNLATNTTVVTYPPDAQGNIGTATMVYDSNGDVLSSTDPLGHTATNTYDASFNLLSTTDPLGHTTSYTYDANGNKLSTTYPATATSTNTTSYTNYNQFSEPTSTTDEDGNTRAFNYDANYNPATVTDSLGTLMSTQFNASGQMLAGSIGYDIAQNPANAAQFAYDANGNLISKTDALGRVTSYTYNALGQKLTMTEPVPTGSTAAAATTTYTYDAFGNVIETQAPLGRVTYSTYDANGNKLTDTDARGNVTSYKYDALNRLIETDYPDGTKSTKTYDFRNNVVTETDQNGNVTLHQYDLAGRQVAVTQAYGAANATTTTTAYDNAGRMTSQTDALGHATTYTYDAAGNLLSTSGVAGNFSYTYDNARNKVAMTDGDGHTTQYQYDARKRLTVTTYPDQTSKTNAYDGPGNLVSVTDQAGNQVDYAYDAANQLINVVQVNSPNAPQNTTIYGYDANGNPIVLEDANTHTTLQSYDLASELTSKLLPDATHSETRTYDQNGNLATVTHFNGTTTTYTYDQLNRLLSRVTPGETTVSFTYTATGKRQTMSDQSGTTNYSYDSMDRLTTKATPEGTLAYTYDAAGNLQSMSSNHANGVSVSYTYDDLNRLATVADARLTGNGTTSYSYDNANNVGTVAYPNGITTQFTYDLLNRVSSASSQVSGYTYQRGPTGNLTNVVELGGRQVNWTYDGIYRLTNETIANDSAGNNGAVSYSLDPVGNRLSDTSSLEGINPGSWGYNSDDEVSSETYDANGNVTAADGKTFAYDSENHLMSMNSGAVSIVYDGDGNRVAKTVSGVTTYYLVDDLNPTGYSQVVEELSGAGVVTRQYTYGLQRISESQVLNGTWTASFYGYDGGGNVRQLTNAAGTVTDSYEYDAYGNEFTVSGTTPNEMLYRGEQFDADLGLYYLRARYYNPSTGRFMSRDPEAGKAIDPKTLHKYLYAGGDPVNMFDPTGRDIDEEGEIDAATLLELETKPIRQEAAYNACMEAVIELLGYTYGFNVGSGDTLILAYGIAKGICGMYAAGIP